MLLEMASRHVAWLCALLLLCADGASAACKPADIDVLRKDVENAFSTKSFADIANEYGESQGAQVILENEYDDENPTVTIEFKSIAELSKWFFEKHEFSEHMIIPPRIECTVKGCAYELPELTLHHGIYLLGFEVKTGRCTSLLRLHIYWG